MPETSTSPEMLAATGPVLIGWKEYISFPEWHLRHLRAKVDTGACTSAIDVKGYEIMDRPREGRIAILEVALDRQHRRCKKVQAAVVRMVEIRSSNGKSEERPVVETLIQLGPIQKRIHLTVADRSRMRYRMLLGREGLGTSFLVDVGREYVLGAAARGSR